MARIKYIILVLSICGFIFSGYLSAYKIVNKSCALGESCPYFMGIPACYFGFIMFLTLTVLSAAWVTKVIKEKWARGLILIVSFLGILFSGYFTSQELPVLFTNGVRTYALGLPTCAFGLIFYVSIFTLALLKKYKR
jgi:uncharacterized membrane protein